MPFPSRIGAVCRLLLLGITIGVGLAGPGWVSAFWKPESLPEIDRRALPINRPAGFAPSSTSDPSKALAALQVSIPGVRVDIDPIRATPLHIRRLSSPLTGPGGLGGGISLQSLEQISPGDRYRTIRAFVEEHAGLYGETTIGWNQVPDREVVASRTGVRTALWEQRHWGIRVFEAVLIGHLTRENALLGISSTWVNQVEKRVAAWDPNPDLTATLPPIPAFEAIQLAWESLELNGQPLETDRVTFDTAPTPSELAQEFRIADSPGSGRIRLTWLPLSASQFTLAWQVELTRTAGGERYQVLIDARSGDLLLRRCLTLYLQDATFDVFTHDSPSPFSPGFSKPDSRQPALVPRTRVTLSAASTNASPLGWIAEGENETRGNNVDAHLDLNADDYPDLPRPHGSPFRVFAPPLNLNLPAEENQDAAVVQLFYWCNQMHDWLYDLGFDEAAGNFQKDNFGRGGLGGDPVLADAQDGSGVNNANFTPSPDGEPGRIQMYVFDGPDPSRDGDLDAEIILHEYTHGLSTRLVGGGVGLTTLQAGGLGEGWSDFYALSLLSESGDDPNACYAMGAYVTRFFFGLEENYYYGIRRYPYSTDLTKNPLTFKDIDPAQISPHAGIPRSPVFPFSAGLANEVHNQGEVWCVTLWEARARLIAKFGFEVGNRRMLQWVTDGMKLTPPNPNFLQARDGILQAAAMDGGADAVLELWKAFAKRGMGFSATSPVSTTTAGVEEAFDLPDALVLTPSRSLVFSGAVGGPFFGGCQSLVLSNQSEVTLRWALGNTQSWVIASPTSGDLAPHTATSVSVCLEAGAADLPRGRYLDTLSLTNLTSGVIQRRTIDLRVLPFTQMPFHDDFEADELSDAWLVSKPPYGRVRLTSLGGPHGGKAHMAMDSDSDGIPARNEVTLGIDLRGWTNVVLSFWAKEFSDEPNPPPASPFRDGADFDGVAISEDGIWWYEVQSLRGLGSTNQQLVVSLDNTLLQYGLSYGRYMQIRFTQFDNYPIPLDGIAVDDVDLSGTPVGRFSLELPEEVAEGDPVGVMGKIRLAVPAIQTVRFSVQFDGVGSLDPIADVVIPAGASEGVFTIRAPDNLELDGARLVTLRATTPGYYGDPASLGIRDNETALLTLNLPTAVDEGAGVLPEAGVVEVDRPGRNPLRIELQSGDSRKLSLPDTLFIPAGETRATFDLQVVDGRELEGDVSVSVTASVPGWTPAVRQVVIHDNESPTLQLTLPISWSEGNPPTSAKLRLGGTLSTNLVVSLLASDPARLSVSNSVVVKAGSREVSFPINAIDDDLINGAAEVRLTASAPGFNTAEGSIRVLDDETPSLVTRPFPPDGASNQPPRLVLSWQPGFGELLINGDFERGSLEGWERASESDIGWVLNDGTVNPDGPDTPTPAFEGDFNAVLAQNGPGKHSIWQTVSIPADIKSAQLTWVDYIHNQGPEYFNPTQQYRVEVQDPDGKTLETAFATQPGDPLSIEWTARSFDLTAYRGQTIRIAFAEEDLLGFINVGVDKVSLLLGGSGVTTFEVYFSTNALPGPGSSILSSATNSLPVSGLLADSDYYWHVTAIRGAARVKGPLWTFHTRTVGPLDHFEWDPVGPVQEYLQEFSVKLTARDEFGFVSTNFTGPVQLKAMEGFRNRDTLLITEVDPGGEDQAEFSNVSDGPIDVSGWKFYFYDQSRWPTPRLTFTAPNGLVIDPGQTFLIRESGKAPGTFPLFRLGTPVNWGFLSVGVPTAVLVMDAEGRFIDFFCAVDGNASAITNPIAIPSQGWNSAPLPPINTQSNTWQRVGSKNHGGASDWVVGPRSIGELNTGLALPFEPADPIAIVPDLPAQLVQGVWSGTISLGGIAPTVTLRASDGSNHVAYSSPFSVRGTNDLSVQLLAKPTSLFIDQEASFVYAVSNSGPAIADGILFRDTLPSSSKLATVTVSSGTWSSSPDGFLWRPGALASGAIATIQLRFVTPVAGGATNRVQLELEHPDVFLSNNQSEDRMDVLLPVLVIPDVTVDEGDVGTNMASFSVRLSAPITREVRVQYTTADDGATAGSDYIATSGTLIFPPGSTRQTIQVAVLGDTLYEVQERFLVRLFDPVNATLGDAEGKATIRDEETPPQLSLRNVSVLEGNAPGEQVAQVPVLLTGGSSTPVTVSYFTADGSALAGSDYVEQRGQLIFAVGVTQLQIRIPILGDRRPEPTESFSVILTNMNGASALVRQGFVTILDDDSRQLSSLAWSSLPSTQYVGEPFQVTLTALDSEGHVATSHEAPASLQAFAQRREAGPETQSNLWEFPFRTYFHDARSQFLYLTNDLGGPGRISSVGFHVATIPGQPMNDFTLRLKQANTNPVRWDRPDWEENDWITVWQHDLTIPDPGWISLPLDLPFDYDGLRPLLVDMSFDNQSYSSDGLVYYVETRELRGRIFESDSAFGPPLEWIGIYPPARLTNRVAQLSFTLEVPVAVQPARTGPFVAGQWTGQVSIPQEASAVRLEAVTSGGVRGISTLFEVVSGIPESLRPAIVRLEFQGPDLVVEFRGQADRLYQLEASESIQSPTWSPVGPVVAGSPTGIAVHDPGAALRSRRFYRIRQQQ